MAAMQSGGRAGRRPVSPKKTLPPSRRWEGACQPGSWKPCVTLLPAGRDFNQHSTFSTSPAACRNAKWVLQNKKFSTNKGRPPGCQTQELRVAASHAEIPWADLPTQLSCDVNIGSISWGCLTSNLQPAISGLIEPGKS